MKSVIEKIDYRVDVFRDHEHTIIQQQQLDPSRNMQRRVGNPVSILNDQRNTIQIKEGNALLLASCDVLQNQ
jgi:hypothetical protein